MTDQRMTAAELAAQPPAFWQRVAAGEVTVTWWNKQPEPHSVLLSFVEEGANEHWVIADGRVELEFSDVISAGDECRLTVTAPDTLDITTPDKDAEIARLTAELEKLRGEREVVAYKLAAANAFVCVYEKRYKRTRDQMAEARQALGEAERVISPFAQAWLSVPDGLRSTLRIWNGEIDAKDGVIHLAGATTEDLEIAHKWATARASASRGASQAQGAGGGVAGLVTRQRED